MPGIDLRLGRFRRSSSDDDLATIITTGIPGVGMPGFKLQPAELTGIVAFIRAGFDAASASVRVGNVERGKALFEGKAVCAQCHRVKGAGPARGAGPERDRRHPHAGGAATHVAESH